ncbi:enoyl-CoA hydratase domain-containing protein 3, mitochondrial-like [Sycon ciliatum]|uniref:enoyl-CoA hydratase domain-containing protein 3, mitochondrial-like n=1 Tax=Sycon ciliatum TaxID=27933 RepID=UPI0020AD9CCA|eukprot:scpid81606/ scgid11746/ Enoyl-CoA hydratase domain-containing protein 3, mitochondrial
MAGRLLSRALGTSASLLPSAGPASPCARSIAAVHTAHRNHSSHSSSILQVSQRDGVRRIVLNNEPKRNALSYAMLEALGTALMPSEDAKRDENLSCVVISAKGKVFSSGHDLSELRQPISSPTPKELFDLCSFVMQTIHNFPVPVVAQVAGLATAAGCQLVASCDMVLAGESARFATPGVNIGLFCTTPSVPLLRCISEKKGAYMLFTGEPISAQEALIHGLVSKVVPDDELESATNSLVNHLSGLSKEVLTHGKVALSEIAKEKSLESAYRVASHYMAQNAKLDDCQEGIDAFFGKRKPNWKD